MTDRARVPFAIIGVLLLVASGTVAVSQHEPAVGEPDVDRAMDRLTAESHTAVRVAVREAALDAARRPVVRPANTTVGDALDETQAFEDALRLRIYLAAQSNLATIFRQRRDVNLTASLPSIGDEGDVAAAIDRVSLARAGPDGNQIRVRIDAVRLRAWRGGRLVGQTRADPELVVDSPVLVVDDRVDRFEQRLRATVGTPGLASRLTAALYPIAWIRGWSQYYGGPIENVVANDHVAVVANGAVLSEQRAAFGRSDPVGRRVYAVELAEVTVDDLAAASNSSALDQLVRLRGSVDHVQSGAQTIAQFTPPDGSPAPSDNQTVDIGETADLAYLQSYRSVNETLDATFRPRVRARADVQVVNRTTVDTHDSVGGELRSEWTRIHTTVLNRTGTIPPSADGWHRLDGFSRTVIVRETAVREWQISENETERTSATTRIRKTVDVVLESDHVVGPAPDGDIASVHERGGPFDGPNLVDAEPRLRQQALRRGGGRDGLAASAATGTLGGPWRVEALRSERLAGWARPDLAPLRREIRAIAVTVERGEVASFRRNVAAELADQLRARRADLVDTPDVYDNVSHRARVGVRAAYVDRVIGALEARSQQFENGRESLHDALPTETGPAQELLATGYEARESSAGGGGQSEDLVMAVDTSPSYLTVEPVGHDRVPAIPANRTEHPLVVRNVNGIALPTGDVVEALFGLLEGPEKMSLRSAAQVLNVTRSVDVSGDGWQDPSRELGRQVRRATAATENSLEDVLADHGLGDADEREAVVNRALDRWDDPAARAAAVTNGSAARAVHEEALDRWPGALDSRRERERLAIELRFAAREASEDERIQPTREAVNETADVVRGGLGYASDAAQQRVEDMARRRAARLAARMPSGAPVVPAPGMYYATVNVWQVQVRGSYARFAVRARRGAPDRAPPDLTYVRENRTVRLDVDGDGHRERLGENRRISVRAETVIGVAVPPGAQGVGDVGERDERSPGWPEPGPVAPGNGSGR